jgi:uncharacterized repeat protein (TIGR03803 family)
MQITSVFRHRAPSLLASSLFLVFASAACATDTYSPSNHQLSIHSLQIGSSTYSNMVVTIGRIVSGPTGSSSNGSEDTYDPGINQLTVRAVSVGSSTYYNVVVTVADLVSVGSVTGADIYNGTELTVSQVQSGGTVYGNVAVSETLGNVIRVAGGMPTAGPDTYSSITNQLSIPAVQVGSRVYTNVVVTAGKLLGVGGVIFRNQESPLYSFLGYLLDATQPVAAVIQGSDGNFYGTTQLGGAHNSGTVFKLTPAGVETVLYSFGVTGTDGSNPITALIEGSDGNFYGTTPNGGAHSAGTFFKITPGGIETVLYSFGSLTGDGTYPLGALILGNDGNFYSVTANGGVNAAGTIYKITPAGVETVLYSFQGGSVDGSQPYGALTLGADGNFYGTTDIGGASNSGIVFKMTPAGAETMLYSFKAGTADGNSPNGALIQGSDGNFYGTTYSGGTYGTATTGGTVFKITPAGIETVLYSFQGGTVDGSLPYAGLALGSDGSFYGTTYFGGAYGTATTGGTVFRITPAGIETVLHSFGSGTADGSGPEAGLILGSDGNFYSTTQAGGTYADGTVFKITPAGAETVVYSFGSDADADGSYPFGPLIQGSDGNFYVTTGTGGAYNYGSVVKITPEGAETVLHSFGGGNADGSIPEAALIQGSDGNFYGTTGSGGTYNNGTVFKITATGDETVLYSFKGGTTDGSGPQGALVQGSDGNFYGTTGFAGASNSGTAFGISPAGAETMLYSFGGGTADGSHPDAALIQGSDGNFYGTTQTGGTGSSGTVFKVTPAGVETVLYSFTPSEIGTGDADQPYGALIQGVDGNFYGTTGAGGTVGSGTIFKVTPAGMETVLYSFGGAPTDGSYPSGTLIRGSDGSFYGTTAEGGTYSQGTVFKIAPTGVETVVYSFGVGTADGSVPSAALFQGSDGSFYGTTAYGGTEGDGTYFKLTNIMTTP